MKIGEHGHSDMLLSEVFARLVLDAASELTPPASCGRKRTLSDDEALALIFKLLRTGMQWRELKSDVHCTTVLRRLHLWKREGVFHTAYAKALSTYQKRYCRAGVGKNHTDEELNRLTAEVAGRF